MSKSADAVTVVIPVHNMPERLDNIVPAWGLVLEKTGRNYQILIVDDGSTDTTPEVAAKLTTRVRHTRLLKHDAPKGYGACLKTALAETTTPLFFYTAVDYPYTPSDIRLFLERIELKDEVLLKQPDLISGCRNGLQTPEIVIWIGTAWKFFWRVCAGLPISDRTPWLGWREFWFSFRVHFTYAIPLVDVNSCFKLFRTSFLKKVPIQSDGDFVHTELVAKATFLTSIMDEVPLTPKAEPLPAIGSVRADQKRVFQQPEFSFPPAPPLSEPAKPVTTPPVASTTETPSVSPSPGGELPKTETPPS
jgi:glycosyltransferase involved in cell wall biosynthesis